MIDISDIAYSYDGEHDVLQGFSLHVECGEFLCVLGGNGSGKSTLARHLNALLKPDTGHVLIDGMDTVDPGNLYDIRSRVGLVFQNPDDQLVATLVEDDVAFGLENLGLPSPVIAQRVSAALEAVGLMGFERHETAQLSGGQKQRVAIAGVLAMKPQVIVFDEASSMLDPRGRAGLMKMIRELRGQGLTIVMITHYMDEAAQADRVIVLDRGRIALEGAPAAVFSQPKKLTSLGLELPPAARLSLALRERGIDIPFDVDEDKVVASIARTAKAVDTFERQPVPAPSLHSDIQADSVIELEHVYYSYALTARERRRIARRGAVALAGKKRAKWGSDPASVWALEDVSLDIRRGEVLGIAGHTGSGKSTLVQHLNGLLAPVAGRVCIDRIDASDKRRVRDVQGRVGVVFQYPERQLFAATVTDDVAFGPCNLGLDEDEAASRVVRALERVGLEADAVGDKNPFELSGGQQRRVALAGVLAMEPQVLVLDEPAAGLDPAGRAEMLSLVDELHVQGLTVVMVSHSMEDLAEHCDRIAVLNGGSICRMGAPSEVFLDADTLKDVGLGVPAPQRMARELLDAGVALDRGRLYSMDCLVDALVELGKKDGC